MWLDFAVWCPARMPWGTRPCTARLRLGRLLQGVCAEAQGQRLRFAPKSTPLTEVGGVQRGCQHCGCPWQHTSDPRCALKASVRPSLTLKPGLEAGIHDKRLVASMLLWGGAERDQCGASPGCRCPPCPSRIACLARLPRQNHRGNTALHEAAISGAKDVARNPRQAQVFGRGPLRGPRVPELRGLADR